MKNIRFHSIAALLLLIFAAELALDVHRQSLSWDEGDHIFAGYQSWKTADFGLNPEHPPFVKELATLPLLGMHLKTPPPRNLPFFKDETYFVGRDFLFENGDLAVTDKIVFRARMFAAVLSLLMAALVYLATLEIFGPMAALIALLIVVFEPNLIAHGAYVTTDMGVTCFLFATIYALYRFRERPSWQRLAVIGIATGLALASKHSATLLLPIGLTLAFYELIVPQPTQTRREVARQYAAAFAAALAIGLTILWATYGFRFSARPNGVHMTPTLADYSQPLGSFERNVYLTIAKLHILPESYIYGLADIRLLSLKDISFPTYILGQVHAHGVWYYFPVAFIIKSTLPFMLLLAIALYALFSRKLTGRRRIAFIVIPPAVYLLIAIQTGYNIGGRHILPMYPFLAVLIAGAVVALAHQRRAWLYIATILVAWHVITSVRAYPNYLSYSNEAWGGPSQTYRYLSDSNTDWAQQLHSVRNYLDANGIKDCWFAYFAQPAIDYHSYGIPCRQFPTPDAASMHDQFDVPPSITGTILVSAGDWTGFEFGSALLSPFQIFAHAKPIAYIDDGVFVFQGTFDTSFASAFGHANRAATLFKANQFQPALAEAQQAVSIDPNVFQAQMILGDTLAALHQNQPAAEAYNRALAIAQRMEPSAQADWIPRIESKRKALAQS